jgi:hypothetical protein
VVFNSYRIIERDPGFLPGGGFITISVLLWTSFPKKRYSVRWHMVEGGDRQGHQKDSGFDRAGNNHRSSNFSFHQDLRRYQDTQTPNQLLLQMCEVPILQKTRSRKRQPHERMRLCFPGYHGNGLNLPANPFRLSIVAFSGLNYIEIPSNMELRSQLRSVLHNSVSKVMN